MLKIKNTSVIFYINLLKKVYKTNMNNVLSVISSLEKWLDFWFFFSLVVSCMVSHNQNLFVISII